MFALIPLDDKIEPWFRQEQKDPAMEWIFSSSSAMMAVSNTGKGADRMEREILLSMLTAKDAKQGYGAFLELERLSEESDDLYPYTERFADMVSDRAWAV